MAPLVTVVSAVAMLVAAMPPCTARSRSRELIARAEPGPATTIAAALLAVAALAESAPMVKCW